MFSRGKDESSENGRAGGRELQKLKRQDLLELLVDQMRESEQQLELISGLQQANGELNHTVDRLKDKLDGKDTQIDHLKVKLDDKDVQIERLKGKLDEKDSLLDRLKGRLNDKDILLVEMFDALRTMTERDDAPTREELLHVEEIAAAYCLSQFAREADLAEAGLTEADLAEADVSEADTAEADTEEAAELPAEHEPADDEPTEGEKGKKGKKGKKSKKGEEAS